MIRRIFMAIGLAGIVLARTNDSSAEVAAAEGPLAEEMDPSTLFRAAATALSTDRPADAIATLEALGDRGIVDAVVSYDRGLAYAGRVRAGTEQPGDLGRAAHGFEEARELSSDSALIADATQALEIVRAEVARRRSRAGDPIELEHGVSLGRSIGRLLPENVWAILAALCSFVLAIGIGVRARAKPPRLKVAGTTTSAVAGGLLVLCVLVLYSARDARLHLREAVVVAPGTRLSDDKHVAQTGLAALPEGARVQLKGESGDFAQVIAGRVEGFLPSAAILPLAKR